MDSVYYPERWSWERKKPREVEIDASQLDDAIKFSQEHETSLIKDLYRDKIIERKGDPNDDGVVLGPLKDRGPVTGLVIKNGYVVGEWGTHNRVDVAYSATKSFIATVFGLALDKGLIRDVYDYVKQYDCEGFESHHNSKIKWHHFLQQTSEWEGVLWEKHWRAGARAHMRDRSVEEPGTFYGYNDTRVNKLALSLLKVWRKPLPLVLKENIMEPIETSNTWQWHGYRNSWVTIDGVKMQSVSGGGHWGGGMWINSWDLARYGYLYLRDGKWKNQQLISTKWINMMTTPSEINPLYGYLWWLNTDQKRLLNAPASLCTASGTGNWVFIDKDHDLVIVLRWVDNQEVDNFWKKIVAAL